MKKKKYFVLKLIVAFIVLDICLYIFLPDIQVFINSITGNKPTNIEIVDTEESDKDIVEKYFVNGMKEIDFAGLSTTKNNYIKPFSSYKQSTYNFENKLRYAQLVDIIKNFVASEVVKVEEIGESRDKRKIYGIEIGKGSRTIFFDANVHATEVSGTLLLTKFLGELINKYESNDKDTVELLKTVKIASILSLNPDGYEVSLFGIESINDKSLWIYKNKDTVNYSYFKFNANGVDINRNLPSQNGGLYYKDNSLHSSVALSKTTDRKYYFPGSTLGSEPETKAFMYFILKHYDKMFSYVSIHSMGRLLYAGKPNLSDEFNYDCQSTGSLIKSINGYKLYKVSSEEIGSGNDGTTTDFASELANGFKFSSKTGRLSSDKYENPKTSLTNKFSVVTMETLSTYTNDKDIIKKEYYDKNMEKVFLSLIKQ